MYWLPVWLCKWVIGFKPLLENRLWSEMPRWKKGKIIAYRSQETKFNQTTCPCYFSLAYCKTKLSHFFECPNVPQFLVSFVCLCHSPLPCTTAPRWGTEEWTLAVTAGRKYSHAMRVSANETPDRCLHKLSPIAVAHGLPHPERWGWLWAMREVPGVCVCVCVCVSVFVSSMMIRVTAHCLSPAEEGEGGQLLNIHVH